MKWVRSQFGSVDVDKWRLECRNCGAEVTDNDHACANIRREDLTLLEEARKTLVRLGERGIADPLEDFLERNRRPAGV